MAYKRRTDTYDLTPEALTTVANGEEELAVAATETAAWARFEGLVEADQPVTVHVCQGLKTGDGSSRSHWAGADHRPATEADSALGEGSGLYTACWSVIAACGKVAVFVENDSGSEATVTYCEARLKGLT
ncbi:MAG: hypothetical protein AB7S38_29065 [Vulcanimicrobiota bacterium]